MQINENSGKPKIVSSKIDVQCPPDELESGSVNNVIALMVSGKLHIVGSNRCTTPSPIDIALHLASDSIVK